jgi:DNA-binding transcriptional MerR regulator
MAQQDLYTVAQAAQVLNLSKPALRGYASKEGYRRWLSTEATPSPGMERRFTADDLRLFAFIISRTKLGESHDTVAARIAEGELDTFQWTPPEPTITIEPDESVSAQLVPYERLQVAQALMTDARQREEQAQAQIQALQEQARQDRDLLHQKIEELQ